MFSLHQIDMHIAMFNDSADELENKAKKSDILRSMAMESTADGLRLAAKALERMIENQIEREAREAMK